MVAKKPISLASQIQHTDELSKLFKGFSRQNAITLRRIDNILEILETLDKTEVCKPTRMARLKAWIKKRIPHGR
jgi:uncharacterized protein HemY